MIKPAYPPDEKQRLAAVRSYQFLDTPTEKDLDSITALTASICDVPMAMVSLLDADMDFFLSRVGMDSSKTPRDISFCGHAILDTSEIFMVEDARKDQRFQDIPFVTEKGIIFYAGVRLINPEGFALGTLCVLDNRPRSLNGKQRQALTALAHQVVNLFESKKRNRVLMDAQEELKERNEELRNFAGIVSHDMKMPLANMIMTSDLLQAKYGELLDEQAKKYLGYIKQSSFTLSEYISGLLEHYETNKTASYRGEIFDSHDLFEEIIELLNINVDCEINLPEKNIELRANRSALEQIILNLVNNSIKYNDKEKIRINIECFEKNDSYHFSISDNGMGIPENEIPHIFDLFGTLGVLDRNGRKGNGIGLSTVKKLVTKLQGEISVSSILGIGATFKFHIKKNDAIE